MPFQVVNPMEAMQVGENRARANQLARMQQADLIRARQQEDALNQLYQKAYNPQTGQIDTNALYGGMADRYMGAAIPKMQAAEAELAAKRATSAKTMADADKQFWSNSREELAAIDAASPNAQAAYAAWATRMVQRAPWAAKLLPETLTADSQKTLLRTADMVLPKGEVKDIGGATATINPYTGSQIGTQIAEVPLPENVVQQKERIAAANKPVTNINMPAAKEFAKTLGEKSAAQLDTMSNQAQSARRVLESSERLRPLLQSKEFISGTLGDVRLAVAKALGLPGAEETQAYFAAIGDQVGERIKAFGAGTGLSDADRKFAEKIAGGSQELTPEAIKRIVKINEDSARAALKVYSERREFLAKKNPEVKDYYPEITYTAGPVVGSVQDGYRFKGGSPADPANWEKVK
jgi:hypothetical protein